MGLATIDSHSLKELTEIHKRFPSLVLIRLVFTEILPFENVKIYKEMYGNPDAVRHGVRMPYISVKTSLINTKLRNLSF